MINLNHLKYFYDVCRYESFTKSAQLNKVSHSAISQAIRNLEQYYQFELVVHKKNHFELTDAGNKLFESINQIFDSVKASRNKLEKNKLEISGDLKLGFSHSMGMSFIPDILKSFHKKYAFITPKIKLGNSSVLADLILNREVEIGIGVDDASFYKLESTMLKKGRFVIVSSKKPEGCLLSEENYIVGDKGYEVDKFKQWYQKEKFIGSIIEIQSWEVIARLVSSGIGLGLIPDYILETPLFSKLHIVKTNVVLPSYDVKAYYRNKDYLSRNALLFLEQLSEN